MFDTSNTMCCPPPKKTKTNKQTKQNKKQKNIDHVGCCQYDRSFCTCLLLNLYINNVLPVLSVLITQLGEHITKSDCMQYNVAGGFCSRIGLKMPFSSSYIFIIFFFIKYLFSSILNFQLIYLFTYGSAGHRNNFPFLGTINQILMRQKFLSFSAVCLSFPHTKVPESSGNSKWHFQAQT